MNNLKKRGFCAAVAWVLFIVIVLVSCRNVVGSPPPDDGGLVDYLRNRMTETLPPPDGENVYWVRMGTVYHLTPECRFLAGSEDIICSSAAESGKSGLCSACEKAADAATSDVTETEVITKSSADETTRDTVEITSDDGEMTAGEQTTPSPTNSTATETPTIDETQNAVTSAPDTAAPSDPDTATVYWTESGKVWHSHRSCPSLTRSKDVRVGTIEESGKERACKRCG